MSLLDTLAGSTEVAPQAAQQPTTSVPASTIKIIEYNASADPQAAEFLQWLWHRMQKDDLVDLYFPGREETGYTALVSMFAREGNVPVSAALFDTGIESGLWNERIPGFITWSTMQWGASPVLVAGFIFFREFWDHHTTDDAAHAAFSYWFDKGKGEVILGVCPSEHRVAMRYNKRVGLKEMMRLPKCALFHGEKCDAVVVGITREDWARKEGQDGELGR